ncbi:MAG TPA: hypothetical protein VFW66_07530 [Gemmatimonadales bacterium]|nr:hypothetical protein [Gemmatimonadales bacterium]
MRGDAALALLALLAACSTGISPFRGRARIGRDAYAVFVGDAPGNRTDLFGVRADGGEVVQITFSNVAETAPALSPDGSVVAFIRQHSLGDSARADVWVMNLLSGAERELPLGADAARPERVGWWDDGRVIYVRAGAELWRLDAPPAPPAARPVAPAKRAAADSSLAVWLGAPPFARVVACGDSLCAQGDSGRAAAFAAGHDPVRWGPDSVGYVVDGRLVIRPDGPGHGRPMEWTGAPAHPRQFTFFPGLRSTDAGPQAPP